jgi:O-antigen/teichoic acid export membrane protein
VCEALSVAPATVSSSKRKSSMSSPRLRILLNIVWLVIERLARIAAGLAVGIVVARYLGPTNYGKISYIQAIVAVAATVAGMGLEPVLMMELIAGKQPRITAYSSALGIAALTSVAATVVGLIYSFSFVGDRELRTLFIIAFSCLPLQTATIIAVPLQAEEKFALLVRYQLVQIAISVALRFLLVWLKADLAWFMLATGADALVWVSILLRLKYGHETKFHARHIKRVVATTLAAAGAPLFVTNLVVQLQVRIDQMLLGILAPASAVGNFSVASRLAEALMMGPSVVIRALNPQLLRAQAISSDEFHAVLRRQFDISVAIAILIACVFCAASKLLVSVLFGGQYHTAAASLAILSWVVVPMTIGSVNANAIIAQRQTKQTLVKATIGLGVNALLNFMFIPIWGSTGSAAATLSSHICSAYFGMLIFQRQRFQFVYASRALFFPATLYRYRSHILSLLRRAR